MSNSTKPISPLRQRMIDDMTMNKLSPNTQHAYLHVTELNQYLGRSPHTATAEGLRGYQLHLVKHGNYTGSINARLSGLRFFFEVTLDDANVLKRIKLRHYSLLAKIPSILVRNMASQQCYTPGALP